MSLYRRGGVWWFHFWFNGEHIQESTKVGNKQDARDIERARWTQLARGEVGLPTDEPKKDPTIGELLDSLEEHFKAGGKKSGKPYDAARDGSNFRQARKAFAASRRASKLTAKDFEDFIQERLRDGFRPATINRTTGLIAEAFRHERLTPPEIRHLSEQDNVRRGFLEPADFARLLPHLPNDLQDFASFAFKTGWRKGEIASLEWSDLHGDRIDLRSSESKNGHSRCIYLEGELSKIIERRKQARLVRGTLTNLIFHRAGAPVAEFRKAWASACVAADLGKMVCPKCGTESTARKCPKCKKRTQYVGRIFHDVRRSAARRLIR